MVDFMEMYFWTKLLKDPKTMAFLQTYLDRKITKIEKKRMKGLHVESDTVGAIVLLLLASETALDETPLYPEAVRKKHGSLKKRCDRFARLGIPKIPNINMLGKSDSRRPKRY